MASRVPTTPEVRSNPALAQPAARQRLSDMDQMLMECGLISKTPKTTVAPPPPAPPAKTWRWQRVNAQALHRDDLHVMARTWHAGMTYLLTAGKDGAVIVTSCEEADQGLTGSEVVPAHAMINDQNRTVDAWVTALALHPTEPLAAVGYRDRELAVWNVRDPVNWIDPQLIPVSAGQNSKQKAGNQGRIHHLSYLSPVPGEGDKQVLAVGVSGALHRISECKTTTIKIPDGEWVNDVLELSSEDLLVLKGDLVTHYRWSKQGWQKQRAVSLWAPAMTHADGVKEEWKKLSSWNKVKAAQGYGNSMLWLKSRNQVAVPLNSGALQLLNLEKDASGRLCLQQLVRTDTDALKKEKLLVTGLCSWVWNDYTFGGGRSENHPSRRCWRAVEIGDDHLLVTTDNGTLPIVNLKTQKVVERILVQKDQRVPVAVWEPERQRLYTHSAPTDLKAGTDPSLYVFELKYQ